METVWQPYVTDSLSSRGVGHWINEGTVEQVGDRTFVRMGKTLCEDVDRWHAKKSAALEDVAARIDTLAARLWAQAVAIREQANVERAKEAAAAAAPEVPA